MITDDSLSMHKNTPIIIIGCVTAGILLIGACVALLSGMGLLLFVNQAVSHEAALAPTPTPCPSVPVNWTIILNENFVSNTNNWPIGEGSGAYVDSTLHIEQEKLLFKATANQAAYVYSTPEMQRVGDFYLTTNIQQTDGSHDSYYGVVIRAQNWNHYFFAISDFQDFVIKKRKDSTGWVNTMYAARDFSIKPGQLNKLTVLAIGENLAFCINDDLVIEIKDKDFETGITGIGILLSKKGDQATLEYSNYKVYAPKE